MDAELKFTFVPELLMCSTNMNILRFQWGIFIRKNFELSLV